MWTIGSLSFLAPWALAALAALPVLLWLLRVTPPSPRLVRFPAIRLLFGLAAREETPARTPWWLVLLRFVLAALVILAVARPLLNAGGGVGAGTGPLLIAVDDGWAAARNWATQRVVLENLLDQAERAERPVILLPTAPPADGSAVAAVGPVPADDARAAALALEPKPWPVDRQAAAQALRAVQRYPGVRAVWLSDGLESPGGETFGRMLQTYGGLDVFLGEPRSLARLLMPPESDESGFLVTVRRPAGAEADKLFVRALDSGGHVVAREAMELPAQARQHSLSLALPSELRNRISRLDIEGEASAGAVTLVDERWRRRPVGLVGGDRTPGSPLLSDLYYAERALRPFAELRSGSVDDLLQRPLAVILMADSSQLPATQRQALRSWISAGGVLVRFAGPNLARSPDDLLPVRLRGGGRTLGGAMSWTESMPLAAFPAQSPFAGLAVPADVSITSQVLAEPEPELNAKTWARLADGTPLVTGASLGQGAVVLIHTTANPTWSNLAMSGLFVDMLRRLVAVSQGVAAESGGAPLPPTELLDGFGRLTAATATAGALDAAALATTVPSPRHPPGFYGDETQRRALNLGPAVEPAMLKPPSGAGVRGLAEARREVDLRPWLLAATLVLATLDLAIAMALRGLFGWRRRAVAAMAAAVVIAAMSPDPALAQAADEEFALKAALETRLAYVLTGDPAVDDTSRAGLAGLSAVLGNRSTVVLAEPIGVDIESDPLLFFPLLYWPATATQAPPSAVAEAKINDFMRKGGMILFDTADEGMPQGPGPDGTLPGGNLARLAGNLAIPPLEPVTEEHVLTRAFYLLRELPGRYDGGTVWVERGGDPTNDGVSPVVIGGHDWAAAWAVDGRGAPLHAVVPGGERQRELSYRFGVNLVMYALTGNYKADQVHLPAILERLGL